jgi:integrase
MHTDTPDRRRAPRRPGPHLAVGPATAHRAAPRRPRLFGPAVTLGDLQAFAAGLEAAGLAPASRRLTLAAVKSLLAFGQRVGYLRFDVGAAVKLPPVKDALVERILDREAVLRLIDREPDARNRALLRLLYAGGLRVSEACALRWRDLQPRDDARQVTVYGKGGKTRVVLLSPATWRVLLALPGAAAAVGGEDAGALAGGRERAAPVFPSRRGGGPLDQPQAWRLARAAAALDGLAPYEGHAPAGGGVNGPGGRRDNRRATTRSSRRKCAPFQ